MANLLSKPPENYTFYHWLYDADRVAHHSKDRNYFARYITEGENILSNIYRNYNLDDTNIKAIKMNFFAQAKREVVSELTALDKLFNVKLNAKYDETNVEGTEQFFKELVEAFNETLNLKTQFERSKFLINKDITNPDNEDKKKNITVATVFPTYFKGAWEAREQKRQAILQKLSIKAAKSGINQSDIQIIDNEIEETIKDALKKMFLSNRVNGTTDEEKDYQQLYNILDTYQGTNELIQRLKEIYKIDELKKSIMSAIKNSSSTQKIDLTKATSLFASKKRNGKTEIDPNWTEGGRAFEVIQNFLTNAILSANVVNNGIEITALGKTGKSTWTGGAGADADNVMTFGFGINHSEVEKTFSSLSKKFGKTREDIIKGITELEQKLANVEDGFIIYESDKAYQRKDVDFAGFHGKDQIPLTTYATATKNAELVAALRQTVKGGIGDNPADIEAIKTAMSTTIANLLFDDFTVDIKGSSLTKLHLFNLSGSYVPLSVLLYQMGRAVEQFGERPKSLITLVLHRPSIKYPAGDSDEEIGRTLNLLKGHGDKFWLDQANETDQNLKISLRFFKNFWDFMRSLS